MGFVRSNEEIARLLSKETFEFYDSEMLSVLWETSPQTVKRLLPPPLKPARRPLAVAYVANFPRTNFGVTYREAGLALRAEFDGVEGSYYLAMPVTDDMALIGGREIFGYPKKIANIAIYREGQAAGGWVERHGIRYFTARAQITGRLNTPDAPEALAEVFGAPGTSSAMVVYNFKFFQSPDWQSFDYPPRLMREEITSQSEVVELGEATVELKPSDFDPWSEVEVVRPLGAIYTRGNAAMRKGQIVAEVAPEAFLPYSMSKVDPF